MGGGDLIDEAVPTRNVLAHPARYEIDPQDHIDTRRRLRGTTRSVLGAYHSHLGTPAVPSPRDLVEAYYPEFVWLIVSLESDEPDYRLYRIAGGSATDVSLLISDERLTGDSRLTTSD